MIDVLIITFNEALNLPYCLQALQKWAHRIYVIDSGSTDGTQEVATSHGATLIEHEWEGYAKQKNWALKTLPFESPWILIIDADEVITPQLRTRMEAICSMPPEQVQENGFFINRMTIFMGQRIRHCGYFPSWNMRLFKQGKGVYEDREVHEHIIIDEPVGYMKEPMLHHDRRGLELYFAKHNRYSTLEARARFNARMGESHREKAQLAPDTRRHRRLKRIAQRVPLPGLWRFLYMFLIRLGFLDGRTGFKFCWFISVYESMVELKFQELRRRAATSETEPQSVPVSPSAPSTGLAIPEGYDPLVPQRIRSTIGQKSGPFRIAGQSRIIGMSVYHGDAAAAGLVNGQFITGVEEERFTRIKHWAGYPRLAVDHCLREIAGGDLANVSALAVARMPRAHFWRKVLLTLLHPRLVPHATERIRAISKVNTLEQTIARTCGVSLNRIPQLYRVEHHMSHLASSFFCSPYDEAMCLTVDGFGDFTSTMRAIGRGNGIDVIDRIFYPHSLGVFYTAITQYLGFPNYGDEYKMMGLAAYGEPTMVDKLAQVVPPSGDGQFRLDQKYFRLLRKGVDMTWEEGEPYIGPILTPALESLLGHPPRQTDQELTQFYRDVAASTQALYEQRYFALVRSLQRMTGLKKLALAGGCALNSLANGKLFENTDIEDVFIQPAAGDAGTALGAALYVYHAIMGHPREFVMEHSCWGPRFEQNDVREAIASGISASNGRDGTFGEFVIETVDDEAILCDRIAESIESGDVVGWYQSRSEWGPRALGNRSILADPRRDDMRDILNTKIKRRESFRPFAPSILQERVDDWFTISYPDPFMLKVYPVRPEKRSQIPAVTHVDGTGRLQTVSKESNPRYYRLISAFESKTGVPILLNTSFNENEPIVNTPREALDCFLRTNMDRIVLENVVISRNNGSN